MGYLFDTLAEYETEITFVREQIQNAIKATDFSLDTNQSRQRVIMSLKEIRLYLTQLTTEKQAFIQDSLGARVTGLTYRRF